MADGVTVRIEGLRELRLAVNDLRDDLKRGVIRGALREAARPIVRSAQANAPVLKKPSRYRTPGLLKRSIKVYNSKRENGRNGTLGVFIAVRGNKKTLRATGGKGAKNPNDPFYWVFQEFGFTAVGRRRIGGGRLSRPGRLKARLRAGTARKIPGKRFMTNAFNSSSREALAIFQGRMKRRIEQANRRV